jgi:hypothetical protein
MDPISKRVAPSGAAGSEAEVRPYPRTVVVPSWKTPTARPAAGFARATGRVRASTRAEREVALEGAQATRRRPKETERSSWVAVMRAETLVRRDAFRDG